MRKSILTLVLFASIQVFSFAQQQAHAMTEEGNLEKIVKIVDDKDDITGTFANTGNWEIFVDDAKVDLSQSAVKEIEKKNLQDLMQAGLKFVQKDKTKYACYRYRVVSEEGDTHTMFIYECNL